MQLFAIFVVWMPFLTPASGRKYSGGNVSVKNDPPLSAADQLAHIRTVLGASITDLAELLNVARPAVYAWIQGTEPEKNILAALCVRHRKSRPLPSWGLRGC